MKGRDNLDDLFFFFVSFKVFPDTSLTFLWHLLLITILESPPFVHPPFQLLWLLSLSRSGFFLYLFLKWSYSLGFSPGPPSPSTHTLEGKLVYCFVSKLPRLCWRLSNLSLQHSSLPSCRLHLFIFPQHFKYNMLYLQNLHLLP